MKLYFYALLLTIPFFFPQNPDPKVFDCVVTEVKGGVATVIGDSRNLHCAPTDNQEICVHATLDIPLESWPKGWGTAQKGSVVHAQWVDGHFRPVPCKSEQMRGIYDRPALNAKRAGSEGGVDCSRLPSAFIQGLLERIGKQ